jgi:hypothetical protein
MILGKPRPSAKHNSQPGPLKKKQYFGTASSGSSPIRLPFSDKIRGGNRSSEETESARRSQTPRLKDQDPEAFSIYSVPLPKILAQSKQREIVPATLGWDLFFTQ